MTFQAFNIAILIGWVLVLLGGCLIDLAAGLAGAGLLLILLTIYLARMAGVYRPAKAETEGEPCS